MQVLYVEQMVRLPVHRYAHKCTIGADWKMFLHFNIACQQTLFSNVIFDVSATSEGYFE